MGNNCSHTFPLVIRDRCVDSSQVVGKKLSSPSPHIPVPHGTCHMVQLMGQLMEWVGPVYENSFLREYKKDCRGVGNQRVFDSRVMCYCGYSAVYVEIHIRP